MSLWICPLCGKQNSISQYDPTNFDDDIMIIQMRGLGRGKGFEIVDRYSLRDGSDPELLDLISNRVAILYDMLYEDVEDEEEEEGEEEHPVNLEDESLSELDKEILYLEREEEEEEDNE